MIRFKFQNILKAKTIFIINFNVIITVWKTKIESIYVVLYYRSNVKESTTDSQIEFKTKAKNI